MTLVRFRVDLPGGHSIGPGKIRLLELLEQQGSISAAARAMRISYRQAWILLNDLNESLGAPLFETATGGRKGGGARLTPLGRKVVERYRVLADAIDAVARRTLRGLLGSATGSENTRGSDQRTSARSRSQTAAIVRKRLARHSAPRSGRRP
jgi:molybdate transport system regulatory protein